MIRVALFEPEIPPNTGNIIRLCANSGAALHLVRPLGFTLDDAQLRRAGLDYREYAPVQVHDSLDALLETLAPVRMLAFSTRGKIPYDRWRYGADDLLLFGPETRGLPAAVLERVPEAQHLYIPQRPGMRSLNLSNAVAVAVYEAWRQVGFAGAAVPDPAQAIPAPHAAGDNAG
ncbi:MAG: tRNA (cytidine(34)-2'-O)-methyltransferase [Nevskia sp.]|nr:tRNA (cytidine(34)-2'-O)-methyltransferase [Nevskia sp.]